MAFSIYIKETNLEQIRSWICLLFKSVELVDAEEELFIYHGRYKYGRISITVTLNVSEEKGYSCLYFVFSDKYKWESDIECAREAYGFFNTEVICSHPDPDTKINPFIWWRIGKDGEETINKEW